MTSRPRIALDRAFFERDVLRVARDLIGCELELKRGKALLLARIVETEAYAGHLDQASHSFRGPTERCRVMFGPRGHAYVYFSYGNHFCMNVTAGSGKLASAILLRAVEPRSGLSTMRRLRAAGTKSAARAKEFASGSRDEELCNGPGKLAASFGIDRRFDGNDLTHSERIWLAAGARVRRVLWTPRIGLGKNPAAPHLWRCVDANSNGTTRVPRAWPTATRPAPSIAALARSNSD